MPSKFSTGLFPILCLLFAASMWGIIWYPLRLLEDAGLHGLWVTLIIYSAALFVGIFPSLRYIRQMASQPGLLLVFALASGWCNVSFILAVLDGNVVRVLLLFYLSPLWATLLGWLLLGELAARSSLAILALAMIGALTMLWDPGLGYPWPQGATDWLAISSGFSFALSNVLVRKTRSISIHIKTMISWLGVVVVTLTWMLIYPKPLPHIGTETLVSAGSLGIFGIFFMTWALQYGVTHMPVHRSAVILLFEIVAGAVSSQLLTNEIVLIREWIGGAIIMVAAYLSLRGHLEEDG